MLIPVILNIPPRVAHPLLEMLYANGYIRLAGGAAITPSTEVAPPKIEPEPSEASASDLSFLDKLWLHLIKKGQKPPPPAYLSLSRQKNQPIHQEQVEQS